MYGVFCVGWLVTRDGRPNLITRWGFDGSFQGPLSWEELAAAYPDRVIAEEQWRQINQDSAREEQRNA